MTLSRPLTMIAAAAATALTLGACSAAGDDGTISLTLAVETSPGDPLADMLLAFADEVEATMGDEVELQVQTGGATGDEEAVLQSTRGGSVDIAAVSGSVATLDPTFNIMEVPFLFTDRDDVSTFLDGDAGEEMSDSLVDSIGVRVLSFGENGFRQITTNSGPVETSADLRGQRIRVPGSPARVSLFESLGAVPTQIEISEAYLALEQGVLDGQENPLKVIDAFSFDEQQQYLSLTSHIYSPVYLVANDESWADLPEQVRTGLMEAASVASERSRELGEQADAELIEAFESEGMQVNEADVQELAAAVADLREEIAAEIPGDFGTRVLAEQAR